MVTLYPSMSPTLVHVSQLDQRKVSELGYVAMQCLFSVVSLSHPGIPGVIYVFVPVCMPPLKLARDSCSHDNFWTTFGISFIFGMIVGPDL